MLGASGDPNVPGLGFRFDMVEGNPLPVSTGLPGVFEAHVPPHFTDMREAVQAIVKRKYGTGGPLNAARLDRIATMRAVRSSAASIDAEAIEIVTLIAEYMRMTFGRFPVSVPPVFVKTYLQAHRLDTDFYDAKFGPGAYLSTHADHDANWSRKPRS